MPADEPGQDDAGAIAERASELPDVLRLEPAAAARQLRRFLSSIDQHPTLAKWGRDLLTCFLAQMLIDDISPDMKKIFRQFGIEIPDA